MTTCLITAANRGIGRELVRAALSKDWTVYGSVRTEDAARDVAESFGGKATPLIFDVTDHAAVKAAADHLDAPIDVLINNAGIIGPKNQDPLNMDYSGFQETLAVNTLAPLAVAQTFLPHILKDRPGKIVTISSQMSWMGYRKSDRIAYRASKAAVNKVMQGLATELEDKNVPVILIDPGWVRTDMGGDGADNDPADVAKGVIALSENLTVKDTGKFFKWTGEERPF
ncbi:SDR family oxidoreductase [Labrenzia sp. PHM005]|uniref:SDR family oxidoreductase n=1 Tax=Labrenzia sp. PHM005 TaxID=2590016 RepID=UPI0011403807|nr:SDR family oxidoreductase [Labrenzia sp. PHM005]QDG77899.1 SDR family oxidoreductase [Labrenzia sp. PHM005]